LQAALQDDPGNMALRAKLLRVYHAAGNIAVFNSAASEFRELVTDDDGLWEGIAVMGNELSPDNELYQTAGMDTAERGDAAEFAMDLTGLDDAPSRTTEDAAIQDMSAGAEADVSGTLPESLEFTLDDEDDEAEGLLARADEVATKLDLAKMMVGRDVSLERDRPQVKVGRVRLKLENVTALDSQGTPVLKNINFEIRGGEILGVAGVSGNGQRRLAEVVAGLWPVAEGKIYIDVDGKDVTNLPPSKMIDAGLSYIPEERMRDGAIKDFTVEENLILQDHIRPPFSNGIFLNFKVIAEHAKRLIKAFNIKTPSKDTPIKNLSGGNIQKAIMARELDRHPRVLIAAQPTRGVDIGATEYIHEQLLQQRAGISGDKGMSAAEEIREHIRQQRPAGVATMLISEDLDEVRAMSDRIMVIFGGEIMGIVNNDETTVEELGLMMAGERRKQAA